MHIDINRGVEYGGPTAHGLRVSVWGEDSSKLVEKKVLYDR